MKRKYKVVLEIEVVSELSGNPEKWEWDQLIGENVSVVECEEIEDKAEK